MGRFEEAASTYEKCRRLRAERGDQPGLALCELALAETMSCLDDNARGMEIAKTGLTRFESLDDALGQALAHLTLARLHLQEGALTLAKDHLSEAARTLQVQNDLVALVRLAELAAQWLAAVDKVDLARQVYAKGAKLRSENDLPVAPSDDQRHRMLVEKIGLDVLRQEEDSKEIASVVLTALQDQTGAPSEPEPQRMTFQDRLNQERSKALP